MTPTVPDGPDTELAAAIAEVLALHSRNGLGSCRECRTRWPCNTAVIVERHNGVPARVLAAERRRGLVDLMSRSSLGCPHTSNCGRPLSEHEVHGWDDDGAPINAVCPQEVAR